MSMFLSPAEVAELTGIHRGRNGRTREQRQIVVLLRMQLPHFVNAAGRPIIARAVVEGGAMAAAAAPTATWEPRLVSR